MLLVVALLGNAACFDLFERSGDPSISVGDALWYSVVSITTIGYGDFSATTAGGRIGTIVFIVALGLLSFSVGFGVASDAMAAVKRGTQSFSVLAGVKSKRGDRRVDSASQRLDWDTLGNGVNC